jgi:BolA protein
MTMVDRIRDRLNEALQPVHLEVVDESHMHNVPKGAESHFNVFVVSEAFDGARSVARHQAVYRALAAEMAGSIHALALKTLAPAEWTDSGSGAVQSPQCLGGSKSDS